MHTHHTILACLVTYTINKANFHLYSLAQSIQQIVVLSHLKNHHGKISSLSTCTLYTEKVPSIKAVQQTGFGEKIWQFKNQAWTKLLGFAKGLMLYAEEMS